MIGLDTNILVRFFARDDPALTAKADKLMASLSRSSPGYVALAVLVELVRVMRRIRGATRAEIARIVEWLLRSRELVIESYAAVESAFLLFRATSGEFPDCLIHRSCQGAGCHHTATFDRKAARSIGMKLVL